MVKISVGIYNRRQVNDMRIQNLNNNPVRVLTRRICLSLVCAGAGVMVDIDHVLAYYTGHGPRFFHKGFGVLGIVLVIGGISCLFASIRRYKILVLRREDGIDNEHARGNDSDNDNVDNGV